MYFQSINVNVIMEFEPLADKMRSETSEMYLNLRSFEEGEIQDATLGFTCVSKMLAGGVTFLKMDA
jgi:hypothetical protein